MTASPGANILQGERWAVVAGLTVPVAETPWPLEPDLADEDVRPWLLADVYMKVRDGTSALLAELCVATALFLHFGEIDGEGSPEAEAEIDRLLCGTQDIVWSHGDVLLQKRHAVIPSARPVNGRARNDEAR